MSAVGEGVRYSSRPAPTLPRAELREIYLRILSAVKRHMPGVAVPPTIAMDGDLARADTILEATFQNVRHQANSHAISCIVEELGGAHVAAVVLDGTCMRVRFDSSEQQQQQQPSTQQTPINWHRVAIVATLVVLAVGIWMGTRFTTKLALLRDLWPSLIDQIGAVLPPRTPMPPREMT